MGYADLIFASVAMANMTRGLVQWETISVVLTFGVALGDAQAFI